MKCLFKLVSIGVAALSAAMMVNHSRKTISTATIATGRYSTPNNQDRSHNIP
jgi:hypothetical protein